MSLPPKFWFCVLYCELYKARNWTIIPHTKVDDARLPMFRIQEKIPSLTCLLYKADERELLYVKTRSSEESKLSLELISLHGTSILKTFGVLSSQLFSFRRC